MFALNELPTPPAVAAAAIDRRTALAIGKASAGGPDSGYDF